MYLSKLFLCAVFTRGILTHPGADISLEVKRKKEHLSHPERRTLASCTRDLEESGYYRNSLTRRLEKVNGLRAERGHVPIHTQTIDSLLGSDDLLTPNTALEKRAECILDPEVTEGPYWVAGELIRSDLIEGSRGVNLHLDINVIDVSTCKPIPNIYVELWGANATGVYTGVVSKSNGAGLASPENIKNSALRGLQPTNSNGTASFVTIVPGHYVGRTNHLHTITHHGANKLPNNTIQGGTISHVGQFYFEQSLLQTIEKTNPYNQNNQQWTQNSADQIFRAGKGNGDDPILRVTLLGNAVESGLYGFIDVGVNPTAKKNPSPVNLWTSGGGIPNPGSMWAGYPWTKKLKAIVGF